MEWYYAVGDERVGPVSESDIRDLIEAGTISPDTLVWNSGLSDWTAVGEVEIFSIVSAPAPVPAPASAPEAAPAPEPAVAEPEPAVEPTPEPTVEPVPEPATESLVEPVAAMTAAAEEVVGEEAECSQCSETFPIDDVVVYDGQNVCGGCKPLYFKRLQSGLNPSLGGGIGTGGQTSNADLMADAKVALSGHWGFAIGIGFLYNIVIQVASAVPFVGAIGSLIIGGPLRVGLSKCYLLLAQKEDVAVGNLFDGFQAFGRNLGSYLMYSLFVALWAMLLVIPGIIKSYSYAMTFYILAEDEAIGAIEAITRSRELMDGNKAKLFMLMLPLSLVLVLTIIPIVVGAILIQSGGAQTLSISLIAVGGVACLAACLYIMPLLAVVSARFYEDVKPA